MPRTEVVRPKGLNRDLSPYELPLEVWTEGENIHFHRNRVSKAPGYLNVFAFTDSVEAPLFHIFFGDGNQRFWVYAGENTIRKTDGNTTEEMASGFNATIDESWSGCNFNGVLILNQRFDHPQVMEPPDYTQVIDLPHWGSSVSNAGDLEYPEEVPNAAPWGSGSRARLIRPFKNFLLALDCYDELGERYPSMVRWSSGASAGDVPPSWDPARLGERAGLYSLSDSPGPIVDGLTLGDYFVVYKTDAVWTLQFIGGEETFQFRKLFGEGSGAITKECIAEFDGFHFVLSTDGAYIHNGASLQDVMEPWVKDEYFNVVSPEQQLRTKVVADHINNEIWIYYISQESPDGWYDRALIWNWEVKEWTLQVLGLGISHIAEGNVTPVTLEDRLWDEQTGIWDEATPAQTWNINAATNPVNKSLLFSDYATKQFYSNEVGSTYNGTSFIGYVKRIGMDFNDDETFKQLTRITPHVLGQNPVEISVFAEDVQTGNPVKIGTYTFNPTVDQSVDCHVVGRYFGIQFSGTEPWTLTGYTLDWQPLGIF